MVFVVVLVDEELRLTEGCVVLCLQERDQYSKSIGELEKALNFTAGSPALTPSDKCVLHAL